MTTKATSRRRRESTPPSTESVLVELSEARLRDLARSFDVRLPDKRTNKAHLASLMNVACSKRLPDVLDELGREELARIARAHSIPADIQSRPAMIEAIAVSAGFDVSSRSRSTRSPNPLPAKGDVVRVRHRQWFVEDFVAGEPGESPKVSLVCLDDDDAGRTLEVLWHLELGARVLRSDELSLKSEQTSRIDAPSYFGAYLHALRWNCVSAADAKRFQSPFRAGVEHLAHQLTPLMKALELPRVNLFIADDVGLGKTIEAGLVISELMLRQQARFILISAPSSICLQWQTEMKRRFGIHFEIMSREFIAEHRRARGFGINPWSVHTRFIISHSLLRKPEYRENLLELLGDRAEKSLFVLDEAHGAAPASQSLYAVDSEITHAVRELAPRFDNRIFLSATPHNGHTSSFSALLELLDPARFTRIVPAERKNLDQIMVRRLKRDLKKLGIDSMPDRILVQHNLSFDGSSWSVHSVPEVQQKSAPNEPALCSLSATAAPLPIVREEEGFSDIRLAELLRAYTEAAAPPSGRARLPFIRLEQRLLSSPEAFACSLQVFQEREEQQSESEEADREESDESVLGQSDDEIESDLRSDLNRDLRGNTRLSDSSALLRDLRWAAERARRVPDAKIRSVIAWMKTHLCGDIGTGINTGARWSDRRVLLFTEWGDTKRYWQKILSEAVRETHLGEERIATLSGGLSEDSRADLQRRFNASPSEEPLRILIATDAAREGLNLQSHCADLFHIDLPWNPARLEQRNGRIDRTLQPAKEVRCHYFIYPQRPADRVLQTLVRKVEVIEKELGSLGAVLMESMTDALKDGLSPSALAHLESIGSAPKREAKPRRRSSERALRTSPDAIVSDELETIRADEKRLRKDIDEAASRFAKSQQVYDVSPETLERVVDVALRLAGSDGLTPLPHDRSDERWLRLPTLDPSWERTLDSVRRARPKDVSYAEWRSQALLPVTFRSLGRLRDDGEQLHLAHPVTKRLLDRFLAQGFSAHDLERVSCVVDERSAEIRIFSYGRLTLFGKGAARLHDELICVAATWSGDMEDAPTLLKGSARSNAALWQRDAEGLLFSGKAASDKVQKRIAEAASMLTSALAETLSIEADAYSQNAKNGLLQRARVESDAMRRILATQLIAVRKELLKHDQMPLFLPSESSTSSAAERRQYFLDIEHLREREELLQRELETEPEAIASLYEVSLRRFMPVGLLVSYPKMRL